MPKCNAQGFTLLELILVLAVMAVISVAGIAAYQQHVVNFKVERTALQMQSLLEASQSYYAENNNVWPDSSKDTTALDKYLGQDVLFSCPWQSAPTPGTRNPPCYFLHAPANPPDPKAPDDTRFYVGVTVPTTQQNAAKVAQAIASRLPNATVDPTGSTTIKAYQAAPVGSGGGGASTVAGIMTFQNNSILNINANACPAGQTLKIYLSVLGIDGWGIETNNKETSSAPIIYFRAGACPGYFGNDDPCSTTINTCDPNPNASPATFFNPVIPKDPNTGNYLQHLKVYICAKDSGNANYPIKKLNGLAIETCESNTP